MNSTAGKRFRPYKVERKRYSYSIEISLYNKLAALADKESVTMGILVDRCIERYLDSEEQPVELSIEEEVGTTVTKEALDETEMELRRSLGARYESLTSTQQLGLVYLAMFPYLQTKQLADVSGLSYDIIHRLRKTEIGTSVVNTSAERYMWNRRPEFLKSLVERAITSKNPAFAQLASRFFGDEKRVTHSRNLNVNLNHHNDKPMTPKEVDQEVMALARTTNMTPNRFEALYNQEQGLLEDNRS